MENPRAIHHAPNSLSAIIGFIGWAILGVIVGFAVLCIQAPSAITVVEQIPNRPGPGEARDVADKYLIVDSTVRYFDMHGTGFRWDLLRRQILASLGETIDIGAADLNQFASSEFRNVSGKSLSHDKLPAVKLTPDMPRFHVHKGVLQMNMPVGIDVFGISGNFRLIANGDFRGGGRTPKWRPHSIYINSAPLPLPQKVYSMLEPWIIETLCKSDEIAKFRAAWKDIEEIEVTNATVRVIKKLDAQG